MSILNELKNRNILKNLSSLEKMNKLENSGCGVYAGFDPTAQSLHLGNYIQIVNLLRFKQFGFDVYAILGGATGMIGDPSFRNSERKLLDQETLLFNKNKIRQQLEKFGLKVIDNYDFYKDMNIIEFLSKVGKLVNVSYMIAKDSVASRLENGLSFTEFSYQLIQGWDFLTLYKDKNVCIQFGGSDQWGNITTGLDMISTTFGNDHKAVALTAQLLTDENGNKFGKSTGGGNLWLDKEMNKPFSLYQFLYNQPDSQIKNLLMWLTFLSVEEINQIVAEHEKEPAKRKAQEILAFEVVKDIHSREDAEIAKNISKIMFDKSFNPFELDTSAVEQMFSQMSNLELNGNKSLFEQLLDLKVFNSKREIREMLATGAIKWNDQTIESEEFVVASEQFDSKYALLKKGKKNLYLVKIN